jgi:hypothetical protein
VFLLPFFLIVEVDIKKYYWTLRTLREKNKKQKTLTKHDAMFQMEMQQKKHRTVGKIHISCYCRVYQLYRHALMCSVNR